MHQQQSQSGTLQSSTTIGGTLNRKNNNGYGTSAGLPSTQVTGNTGIDSDLLNDHDEDEEHQNCFCFESDDDSAERIKIRNTKRKIARSCVGNIAITIILIIYTLIGSLLFLIIEGGITDLSKIKQYNSFMSFTNLNNNNTNNNHKFLLPNFTNLGEESRIKTVENIWDITVNLNILYRENWTRLAGQEMTRFQEQLVQRIIQEMTSPSSSTVLLAPGSVSDNQTASPNLIAHHYQQHEPKIEWNLAKSFLYSLTLLTTIGFGNIGPKTPFGKIVTMIYCIIGIPLMLIYLTSMGTMLSNCARGVFTRSLCCCLCSNCGYCCYDEQRMAEKEKRMKRKRELKEQRLLLQQQNQLEQQQQHGQQNSQQYEPFYVRSPTSTSTFTNLTNNSNNLNSNTSPIQSNAILDNTDNIKIIQTPSLDCIANTTLMDQQDPLPSVQHDNQLIAQNKKSIINNHGNCIAPILLCVIVMILYITMGTIILYRLEMNYNNNFNITYLDSLFFCFMSLTTIGFCGNENIPMKFLLQPVNYNTNYQNLNSSSLKSNSLRNHNSNKNNNLTLWFCSLYILIGMALTAMCFNIFYDEIIVRFKYNYYYNYNTYNNKNKSNNKKKKSNILNSNIKSNSNSTNTNSIMMMNSNINSNTNLNFIDTSTVTPSSNDNNIILNSNSINNTSSTLLLDYRSTVSGTTTTSSTS